MSVQAVEMNNLCSIIGIIRAESEKYVLKDEEPSLNLMQSIWERTTGIYCVSGLLLSGIKKLFFEKGLGENKIKITGCS